MYTMNKILELRLYNEGIQTNKKIIKIQLKMDKYMDKHFTKEKSKWKISS